jgi:hypothetical protein
VIKNGSRSPNKQSVILDLFSTFSFHYWKQQPQSICERYTMLIGQVRCGAGDKQLPDNTL